MDPYEFVDETEQLKPLRVYSNRCKRKFEKEEETDFTLEELDSMDDQNLWDYTMSKKRRISSDEPPISCFSNSDWLKRESAMKLVISQNFKLSQSNHVLKQYRTDLIQENTNLKTKVEKLERQICSPYEYINKLGNFKVLNLIILINSIWLGRNYNLDEGSKAMFYNSPLISCT